MDEPRVDAAARTVRADAARVFAALLDPDALARWLPPSGMTGRFDAFEPRVGGSYRLVLTYDDPPAGSGGGKASADSDVVEARFTTIDPGERVVQAVEFLSDDPAYAGTMSMTWELEPRGDGTTRVEFRAENVPPGIAPEDHAAGLSSSLANLAAYVEA